MGRSIYCSSCKKEKELSCLNESQCKSCKSERQKKARIRKRLEAGLLLERKAYCETCLEKQKQGISIKGRCTSCAVIFNRERLQKKREESGLPPPQVRDGKFCHVCNIPKVDGRCVTCRSRMLAQRTKRISEERAKRREEKGLRPYGSGRSPTCAYCDKIKEIPNRYLCNECKSKYDKAKRNESNENCSTLICKCGKQKQSTQKKLCDDCRNENKRVKNLLDARKNRAKNGSKVNRSIHCSRCGLIKEHKERGYCLACERERYYEKDKPDCATCGAIKQNPRDAYCHECKRIKAQIKSIEEGRRFKNEEGRKTTCSNCGIEKEANYLSGGYCMKCKSQAKKINRPFRSQEQIFKDDSRILTRLAIKKGFLIRKPCEICNTEVDVQAHHDDYSRPLDVRWLCRKHHQEHHKNLDKKDN